MMYKKTQHNSRIQTQTRAHHRGYEFITFTRFVSFILLYEIWNKQFLFTSESSPALPSLSLLSPPSPPFESKLIVLIVTVILVAAEFFLCYQYRIMWWCINDIAPKFHEIEIGQMSVDGLPQNTVYVMNPAIITKAHYNSKRNLSIQIFNFFKKFKYEISL